jgi:hypothetical protein
MRKKSMNKKLSLNELRFIAREITNCIPYNRIEKLTKKNDSNPLNAIQASWFLGIDLLSLLKMKNKGTGPVFFKVNGYVFYRTPDLIRYQTYKNAVNFTKQDKRWKEIILVGRKIKINDEIKPMEGQVVAIWTDDLGPFIGRNEIDDGFFVKIYDEEGRHFIITNDSVSRWSFVSDKKTQREKRAQRRLLMNKKHFN